MISIQREPVSAVSSDINFPMKGRRGMKDWARSSEDKLFIPREVLSLASAGEAGLGPQERARSARVCTRASECAPGAVRERAGVRARACECPRVHIWECACTCACEHARVSAHLSARA